MKIETESVSDSTVEFLFTQIPPISDDHYVLRVDGEQLATFESGGEISWSYSSWSIPVHNFTLSYERKSEEDSGDDDDGGSIDLDGISLSNSLTKSHSWTGANRSEFTLTDFNDRININQITLMTAENVSELSLTVQRLDRKPKGTESVENPYTYYNIISSPDIESAWIQFEVNESYIQNHSTVVVSRFEDSWQSVDTVLKDIRSEYTVYEAEADALGYYAVHSQNQSETSNSTNQTRDPQPVCGNRICEANETWETCSTDCSKPAIVQQAENMIQEAREKIKRSDPGYSTLQRSETAFNNSNYLKAEKLANQALQRNQSSSSLFITVAGVILLILLLSAGGYLGYRTWNR